MPLTGNHIGLIGGLAPKAGVFYYEQLLERHQRAGARLDLTLRHADVATVLDHVNAGDRDGLGQYLAELSNQLFDAGADVVAVTAVAAHLAIEEIMASARGPVVNLLDTISAGLSAAGAERVSIFGNRAVMTTGIYESVPPEAVVALDPATLESVHDTYNQIALAGKRSTPIEVELLAAVADQAMADGADAIILAGTDLSSFYSETPPEFPSIDLAMLHIEQIMDYR